MRFINSCSITGFTFKIGLTLKCSSNITITSLGGIFGNKLSTSNYAKWDWLGDVCYD